MARLSDDLRKAIADDLRATHGTPEGSYRRVAARHNVSNGLVSKIARECGIPACTEARERTQVATRAKVADNAARRTEIAERLLAVASRAIDDMDAPALVYSFGGRDNTYAERMLSRPDFRGQRDLAQVAKIALDAHKMLDQYDSDAARGSAFDAWLKAMTAGDGNAA